MSNTISESLICKARERLVVQGESQINTAKHLKKLIEDAMHANSGISIPQRQSLKGMYKVACLFSREQPVLRASEFGVHE